MAFRITKKRIFVAGALFGSQVICVCNDGHILGFGGPWKDGWVLDGGPRRRLHYHNDWLVVYGKTEVEHPQPWSPVTKDHQRANLHLYWIGSRDPELLAYRKTDGEPLLVIVSKICSRTVIVVEQKVTQKGNNLFLNLSDCRIYWIVAKQMYFRCCIGGS